MNKNEKIRSRGKRINLNVGLSIISKKICNIYDLGTFNSNQIIVKGFEDFNYILQTKNGKYFVKIFNKKKTQKDCLSILDRMHNTRELGINVPKIYKCNEEFLCKITIKGVKYKLCVLEYIEKKEYVQLNKNELKKVITQVAKLHSIEYTPMHIKCKGGLLDFDNMYKSFNKYLDEKSYKSIKKIYAQFKKINMSKLPQAFGHGDLGTGNIINSAGGKIYLIDFGLSNIQPRVLDLAQIIVNLCTIPNDKSKTINRIEYTINEYEKHIKLTQYEKKVLKLFCKCVISIHILFSAFLTYKDNKESKDVFWLEEGIEILEYYN